MDGGKMLKKVSLSLLGVLILFLGYVSTREGNFYYERSGIINAPAEKIFPYISNLKRGQEWSPYESKDLNMKKTFSGPDGQVGSVLEFAGNSESGSGKLEITKVIPNQEVEIRLTMTKPFSAENKIQYRLTPEGRGTRFSWGMSGDGGFLGKLLNVFIDCEAMVAKDFEKGIENLKKLIEPQVK